MMNKKKVVKLGTDAYPCVYHYDVEFGPGHTKSFKGGETKKELFKPKLLTVGVKSVCKNITT